MGNFIILKFFEFTQGILYISNLFDVTYSSENDLYGQCLIGKWKKGLSKFTKNKIGQYWWIMASQDISWSANSVYDKELPHEWYCPL